MKCALCKIGEIRPGMTTVTLECNGAILIFKKTPAELCTNCGEVYLDDEVTRELLRDAEAQLRQAFKSTS